MVFPRFPQCNRYEDENLRFACSGSKFPDKIQDYPREVCTCSQFPTEAMLWIKEVEMVDSVDDLKNLRHQQEEFKCQILKHSMRRFLQH